MFDAIIGFFKFLVDLFRSLWAGLYVAVGTLVALAYERQLKAFN